MHTYFLQTRTASLHWALCDGNRFLCGRGEGMPQKWMWVFISLPCKSIPTPCLYHLKLNYKFSGERDQDESEYKTSFCIAISRKLYSDPFSAPGVEIILSQTSREKLLSFVLTQDWKGESFFPISLSLTSSRSLPRFLGSRTSLFGFQRKQYRLFEKFPAVTRRRCRTRNGF